jgi:hypothetical protein
MVFGPLILKRILTIPRARSAASAAPPLDDVEP